MKRASYDREIINRGEGCYEVQCVQCGAWFTSQRYDAAFCSSTCRSKHARSKHDLDKRITRANDAIEDLINHLPKERASRTLDALLAIQHRIMKVVDNVESE